MPGWPSTNAKGIAMTSDSPESHADLRQRIERLEHDLAQATSEVEALSEVGQAINSTLDLQAVLSAIVGRAIEMSGSDGGAIYELDESAQELQLRAALRMGEELIEGARNGRIPLNLGVVGEAVRTRAPAQIQARPDRPTGAVGMAMRMVSDPFKSRAVLVVPLLREDDLVGALIVSRVARRSFGDRTLWLLQAFARQSAVAIGNARLFRAVEDRNRALTDALEQQTATSDILRVAASSPTDLQATLDAVVESAVRFGGGEVAIVQRIEGSLMRCVASTLPEMAGMTQPVDRGFVSGTAILDVRTVHSFEPLEEHRATYPKSRAHIFGLHTQLAVPLLRQGAPIGSLVVYRKERQPFSDRQIALIETFAHQVVIAIESARLFQELHARIEELQALGEVSRAVSSSLDL
jgi:two-component system, NtrC family, sensor kinase